MEKIPYESGVNYFEVIKPKNSLEESIVGDAEWQKGAEYGKPRGGHPEGKVIFHIEEVLRNVENLPDISESERAQLRLITIIHDTFKYKVDQSKPRDGKNRHGMLARRFAEKYTDDATVLKIIQLHDEAYRIWRMGHQSGELEKAKKRVRDLVTDLGKENLKLFLLFYQCDNATGTKSPENFQWFKERVKEL